MEHSILAQAYLADGQWKNYEQQVDQLLSMSAVTPRDQLFQGHAIYVHSTEKGLELMSSALKERSDFQLGRVLRARGRIYQALDRGDKNLLGDAELDLAVASESLKDNPLLSHARLYARLAAYSFSKRAGDMEKAKSDLDEAAADVRKLEEHPSFLFGNALRLYFHSFRSEWPEMERVMEEVIEHGNGGFVADAYLSQCFGARRNRDALKRLDRMSNQEDMYVLSSRTILLSETQAERDRADAICSKLIRKYPQGDMSYVGWFLLGKQDDAIQAAKTYAKSMTVATERSFDKDKIRYRGGEIDAKQFLELAGKSEQRLGQAYFHIGVRLLAEQERERALDNFERSAATLIFHVTEVAWAQAFVKRMKDDPKWPEWLLVEPVDVDGE